MPQSQSRAHRPLRTSPSLFGHAARIGRPGLWGRTVLAAPLVTVLLTAWFLVGARLCPSWFACPEAQAQTPPSAAQPAAPAAAGSAGTGTSAPSTPGAPDDSVLGTVVVTGGSAAPLPKLAVVPLITTSDADTTLQLVVRNDLDLCGQFEIVSEAAMPAGPFVHDSAIDPQAWKSKGIPTVVRVAANPLASGKQELLGTAYLLDRSADPVFTQRLEAPAGRIREYAHRMADAVLGALTGRPGGFASRLTYSARVGRVRQILTIDSDGFNLRPLSPERDTAIAPVFGPGGEVYYALSRSYSPFFVARGPKATPLPLPIRGSVYGLAFSFNQKKLAVSVADEGTSRIYVGNADGTTLAPVSTAALANHPIFAPDGRIAYVAGGEKGQRVFVDQKAISPAGFNASAPVFCDTPNGLLVVFTVGVGSGADLVATDVRGGNLMRLTQHQGANSYPACSPDGRLLAFFSTRKSDRGPGLYVVPLANLSHARRISTEVGESLQWAGLGSP